MSKGTVTADQMRIMYAKAVQAAEEKLGGPLNDEGLDKIARGLGKAFAGYTFIDDDAPPPRDRYDS